MAVGSHAEQQEIESRSFHGGLVCKAFDELLFILVGEFLYIVQVGLVDSVDFFARDGNFGEEILVA